MRTLAADVHQLKGTPRNAIDVYLVGDVLVDAGSPAAKSAPCARATTSA